MYKLYVMYLSGRKETLGIYKTLAETYERYTKSNNNGPRLFQYGEVVNAETEKIVEMYY